jgi:hypothetical protein
MKTVLGGERGEYKGSLVKKGKACSMRQEGDRFSQNLVTKPERRRPLLRCRL